LNQPDPISEPGNLAGLPDMLAKGPVFAEPWQAAAFALAVDLSARGYFTWKEWTTALAEELEAAAIRDEPDDAARYYQYWLAALERLLTAKDLADPQALLARTEAWAEAYRRTPHGQPVELEKEAEVTSAYKLPHDPVP
jgi:nitrile hydratase accessory protein